MGYPYCPASNADDFIDLRRLNQLLSDNDTGPLTSPINRPLILASPLLLVHLNLASNRIDGDLLEARRYDQSDLMYTADQPGGVIIRWLCANLAFGSILGRRKLTQPEWADLAEDVQKAEDRLEMYRLGKLILPTIDPATGKIRDSKLDAGVPALVELGSGNNDPVMTNQRMWGPIDVSPVGPTGPQRNWASLDGGEERGDW